MDRCSIPPTTHTLEMEQIAALNTKLGDTDPSRRPPITAADLGLTGVQGWPRASGQLPAEAVLGRICWDGSPEFPDLHGHFAVGETGAWVVDLHTVALQAISRRLATRQRWGI